jgi:RNA polymerase sigma-70 factor (ECF subfamily)
LQGFSYEEIAKVLECPEGTVKSRINRARKALKEILQRRMELLDGDYVK